MDKRKESLVKILDYLAKGYSINPGEKHDQALDGVLEYIAELEAKVDRLELVIEANNAMFRDAL